MEIEVKLLEGFSYSASADSFPVKVIVKSESPLTVDQNINLNQLEFCSQDIEYFSFGLNRTILSQSSNTVELSSNNSIVLDVDLFGEGVMDEEDEVFPGRYQIKASVTVYVQGEDGKMRANVVELDRELYADVTE